MLISTVKDTTIRTYCICSNASQSRIPDSSTKMVAVRTATSCRAALEGDKNNEKEIKTQSRSLDLSPSVGRQLGEVQWLRFGKSSGRFLS